MKKLLLLCALLLSSISTASAYKPLGDIPGRTRGGVATMELTENDQGYVVTTVIMLIVQIQCDAVPTKDGIFKLGDKKGVNVVPINRAIFAALSLSAEMPYEAGDVIPPVTRLVQQTHDDINSALEKDKPAACKMWTGLLRELGVVK